MTDDRAASCAFTGHRPNKLPWGYDELDPRCLRLKRYMFDLVEALYLEEGIRHFLCGMANGTDLYFCETVLTLRAERPGVTVEAAIPCEGQADRWPPEQRRRYDRLVLSCDRRTLVSRSYTPDCMLRRNRYMVDRSRILIAYYRGEPGGTRATIQYAKQQGLDLIYLPVEDTI